MKKKIISILGVPFRAISSEAAVNFVDELCDELKQHYVCTPNPEILLKAAKNSNYLKILQNAALNIADGQGIIWADFVSCGDCDRKSSLYRFIRILSRSLVFLLIVICFPDYLRKRPLKRLTGVDFMGEICQKLQRRVFLLGAAEGIAEKAVESLQNTSVANFVGCYSGSYQERDFQEIRKRIVKAETEFLFVAFGAPYQEEWIAAHLKDLPSVKVAMGVGGAFDYFAGSTKRAPNLLQKIGLEWLYRVLKQPQRWTRIVSAVIIFPVFFIWQKMRITRFFL